jgi:hypothetical protein
MIDRDEGSRETARELLRSLHGKWQRRLDLAQVG